MPYRTPNIDAHKITKNVMTIKKITPSTGLLLTLTLLALANTAENVI